MFQRLILSAALCASASVSYAAGNIDVDIVQVILAKSAQPDGVPAVSRVTRAHGFDLPDLEKNASPQADPGNRTCRLRKSTSSAKDPARGAPVSSIPGMLPASPSQHISGRRYSSASSTSERVPAPPGRATMTSAERTLRWLRLIGSRPCSPLSGRWVRIGISTLSLIHI